MKIVVWTGNEPNQKALVNKIHSLFPLTAIVSESRSSRNNISFSRLAEKAVEKAFLPKIGRAWMALKNYYNKKYPDFPETPFLDVENINDEKVFEFTRKFKPDLIIVSGTRLIRSKLLSLKPEIGILNLHTGLSPYVKGGPNCTNWCIATKNFHLIGNTVMWIDEGIDSGNILTTSYVPLNGNETLSQLHLNVMEHAHQLYIQAIDAVSKGNRQSVRQSDLGNGMTYYNRQWTLHQKFMLSKNFRMFKEYCESGQLKTDRKKFKEVLLPVTYRNFA